MPNELNYNKRSQMRHSETQQSQRKFGSNFFYQTEGEASLPPVSDDYQDEEEDDLAVFTKQNRIKIIKQNKLNSCLYEDSQSDSFTLKAQKSNPNSFNKFYGNEIDDLKAQLDKKTLTKEMERPQINQEQLQAKKLRAFNAAKYFQKIKLTYLKQIFNQTRELHQLNDKKHEFYELYLNQFHIFLSLLPNDLLTSIYKTRSKGVFAIDFNQGINLLKKILKKSTISAYQLLESPKNFSKKLTKTQLMFKFAEFFNCQIRKIEYFNIKNFVDETFYNLNYQKTTEKGRKKSKCDVNRFQDKIKNKIQKVLQQQEFDNRENFVDLRDFSFDLVGKKMQKSQDQLNEEIRQSKNQSKKNQQIKKQFEHETYQMFSFIEKKWKLFVAIDEGFEELDLQWFKQEVLNGQPIVCFYSIQYLKPALEYQDLIDLRKMGSLVLKDMSMHFCDNWKKIANRKRRLGIKGLISKIFRFCNYHKPFQILQKAQGYQFEQSVEQMKQALLRDQMPKAKEQFNVSEYFLTKSRVGKYHILSPEAEPLPDVEFNEEKIFWKDDLIPVSSRMGWIDFSRMVADGEEPLKKTENRNKKQIELYRYEQTIPYQLSIDSEGNFILNSEHNSIYVPPIFQIPEQTCILTHKISYICNRYKINFAKLVQGFTRAVGNRVLPNEIGYILYKKDKDFVIEKYLERQQLLNSNKQSRYQEKLEKMWREIIKYVKLVDRMGEQLK